MKTIIKHIALLAISGAMLPLYSLNNNNIVANNTLPATVVSAIDNPIKQDGDFHFSFAHDVAAKLLPVINFLS